MPACVPSHATARRPYAVHSRACQLGDKSRCSARAHASVTQTNHDGPRRWTGELPPKKKKKKTKRKAVAFEEPAAPAAPAPEEQAEEEQGGRDRLGRLLRLARIRQKISPGRGAARLDAALFGPKGDAARRALGPRLPRTRARARARRPVMRYPSCRRSAGQGVRF